MNIVLIITGSLMVIGSIAVLFQKRLITHVISLNVILYCLVINVAHILFHT